MKHTHRTSPAKRAFTLVELLTVIGIIALLIAILLPALNRARESAKTLMCSNHLRQLQLSVFMYVNDNKGFLPAAFPPDVYTPGIPPGSDYWFLSIQRYTGVQWGWMPGWATLPDGRLTIFADPARDDEALYISRGLHYGYNAEFASRKITQIKGMRGLMADATGYWFLNNRFPYYMPGFNWQTGSQITLDLTRHRKVINIAFLDGHVEPVRSESVTADLLDDK
jgi:prepilin-type N-terminal cleavage/methylation domain-containing protein/prepilin-type processing-associated H-X9-DG protein